MFPFPGLVGYTSSCKVEWICLLNRYIDLWWSLILSLMPKKSHKPDCWWVYWTVFCGHCSLKDWNRIHPWKQTWNLNIPSWKRRNIYKPPILGFHVEFWGNRLLKVSLGWTTPLEVGNVDEKNISKDEKWNIFVGHWRYLNRFQNGWATVFFETWTHPSLMGEPLFSLV